MKHLARSVTVIAALGLTACAGPQGPAGVQGPTGQTGRTGVDSVIVSPAPPVARRVDTVIVAPVHPTRTTTWSDDTNYYYR